MVSGEPGSALERVEMEFSIYRKEKAEVDKLNGEKIHWLEKRVSELSMTNAKLGADVEYAEERFKVSSTFNVLYQTFPC